MKQKSLSELVLEAFKIHFSGSFELKTKDGQCYLSQIQKGHFVKVKSPDPDSYLGSILADMVNISPIQLSHVLASAQKEKKLIGEALVEAGLVTEDEVDRALNIQLERKLTKLFLLGEDTHFEFHSGVDLLSDFGARSKLEPDPFAIIWAGLKRQRQTLPQNSSTDVGMLGSKKMHVQASAQPKRFKFTRTEQGLFEALKEHPMSFVELEKLQLIDPKILPAFLQALLLTEQIRFVD